MSWEEHRPLYRRLDKVLQSQARGVNPRVAHLARRVLACVTGLIEHSFNGKGAKFYFADLASFERLTTSFAQRHLFEKITADLQAYHRLPQWDCGTREYRVAMSMARELIAEPYAIREPALVMVLNAIAAVRLGAR